MRIKIAKLESPDTVFYALERPRLLRRSLWHCESWSNGGDIVKYPTERHAEESIKSIRKKALLWDAVNLKAWEYKRC